MPVEFISLTFPNGATEVNSGPNPTTADAEWIKRYARALDEYGFDYTVPRPDDPEPAWQRTALILG
jgi:alkanesulfonate monooxygenase